MATPRKTGTVKTVGGSYIFIETDEYPNVFAHRDRLRFTAPYIGLPVTFTLHWQEKGDCPVADDVRLVA